MIEGQHAWGHNEPDNFPLDLVHALRLYLWYVKGYHIYYLDSLIRDGL